MVGVHAPIYGLETQNARHLHCHHRPLAAASAGFYLYQKAFALRMLSSTCREGWRALWWGLALPHLKLSGLGGDLAYSSSLALRLLTR